MKYREKHSWLDGIEILVSLLTIGGAIWIFWDMKEHFSWLPVLFFLGSVLSLLEGIKAHQAAKKLLSFAGFFAALFLCAFGIVSLCLKM